MNALRQNSYIFSFEGNRLRDLAIAVLVGVLLYLLVFGFVVHKPLTVGITARYLDHKTRYLESIKGRQKIVVLAGSNGRFSHRCEEIQRVSGIACANLSISADLDLLWQFHKYSAGLEKGDLLYLPLEYRSAKSGNESVRPKSGGEAPYIIAYDKSDLLKYTPMQAVDAIFNFNIKFFLSAVGEMVLSSAGKERRFSLKTMTVNGDEQGHDSSRAQPYVQFVSAAKTPEANVFPAWLEGELIQIFDELKGRGVIVVGGLPTTFDDVVLSNDVVSARRAAFVDRGQCFIVLPNFSLYPRREFYDTPFHLREEAQIEHSRALAPILKSIALAQKCS